MIHKFCSHMVFEAHMEKNEAGEFDECVEHADAAHLFEHKSPLPMAEH